MVPSFIGDSFGEALREAALKDDKGDVLDGALQTGGLARLTRHNPSVAAGVFGGQPYP